ncbi:general substrate transporter [Chlamydoabsidia padenii]|nr:general substrate transporter [Chlamydoabsidia padenii]
MNKRLTANNRVCMYCSLLAVGGFLFGYNFNIMTTVDLMPYYIKEISFATKRRGYIGTMTLGAIVGALVVGVLADRIGRKPTMVFSCIIFLVGSLFQTGADNAALMLSGRAATGFSVGIYSALVPLYQSELAPKHLRGRLIAIYQYAITLGIFCASWVAYGLNNIQSGTSWRLAMGIQMIPCLILLFLICFVPESPRYLMYRNYDNDALHVLSKIHGDGSADHPDVYMEYVAIQQSIKYEKTFKNRNSYARVFSGSPENNRRRLLLGILTQSFQQLTGINPILMFAPQVLHTAGLSGLHSSLISTCISATVNMGATIPALFLLDRFGRRGTMLVGAVCLCICLIVMSILSITAHFVYGGDYATEIEVTDTATHSVFGIIGHIKQEAIAFIAMQYLYVAVFAYTWGPLGWIYPSELYNQGIRAKALSLTSGFSWILTFAVFEFSTPMLLQIHGKSYVVFTCFCVIIIVVVYFYFPETKGKSLEEIDLIFGSNIGYFDVNSHHIHQTAAATLVHMEKVQRKNAGQYPFQLGDTGPHLPTSSDNRSLAPCDEYDATRHPTSIDIQASQPL